ncbi:hypothetical protein FD754_001764 [Muntiacus muntjak]|uniref:PPM-type phosphatase domain-containing protein n=1 Tax=Muntiacus muntjak TaxID=9888 RepID=A0A5N3W9K8_MUNMU|nr:hypothetical protein FD754_001764 [Muntiacus muntjak]
MNKGAWPGSRGGNGVCVGGDTTGRIGCMERGRDSLTRDQTRTCHLGRSVLAAEPSGKSLHIKLKSLLGQRPPRFSRLLVALSPQESEGVSCHYWSLFDGHAGSGAAVVASRLLQQHVAEQLQDIVEILKNSAVLPPACLGDEPDHAASSGRTLTRAASLRGGVGAPGSPSTPPTRFFTEKKIPHECLVIGALESAFKEMDLQIERERSLYNISGGCTALIVVCLLGKLYVANAGDSSGPPVAELGLHGPGPRSLRPVGSEAVLRGCRAQAQWLPSWKPRGKEPRGLGSQRLVSQDADMGGEHSSRVGAISKFPSKYGLPTPYLGDHKGLGKKQLVGGFFTSSKIELGGMQMSCKAICKLSPILRLGELTQSTEDGLTFVKFLIPLWPDLSNSSIKISTQVSGVVAHWLHASAAGGIIQDQGLNLRLLH